MTTALPLEPIEKASLDELRALQLDRLKTTLRHAYENSPVYRRKFDEAGVHPDEALADRACRVRPLAQDVGMLDAGQRAQEAAARGDQQRVVGDLALGGQDAAPAVGQPGGPRRHELDPVPVEEAAQRDAQVARVAQAGGYPDEAGQVGEHRFGRDQRDPGLRRLAAEPAHGGQGGEAGAEDGDVRRVPAGGAGPSGGIGVRGMGHRKGLRDGKVRQAGSRRGRASQPAAA